jgi:FkbM family methyltransferase
MDKVTLVDVGARNGIGARWKPFHDRISVVAFEPDPAECERLNAQQWPYPFRLLPHALGATDGERVTLHVTEQPGCSSLLEPNHKLCDQFYYGSAMQETARIPLTLSRLDTVLDIQPDVIKIDTQGTELEILKGAGKLLDNAIAVECEVEFVEQYANQPLFSDVDAFMRAAGFQLRGIRRTYWRNQADRYLHAAGGQLIHGDALWLNPNLQGEKAHVVLAAYRQFDLLSKAGAVDLIPRLSTFEKIASRLVAATGYTNRELRRAVDRLRPPAARDWHDPDFF